MAWTKAKMAIVVGASVLLAAGTATVAVKTFVASPIDAYLSDPELESYLKAPQLLVIQQTHFSDSRFGTLGRGDGEKLVGRNSPLELMLKNAYGFSSARTILPDALPTERFDYMVTITNRPREHFQSAIKSKLGWVGKRELRDMDVLLLRVINPGGSKLTVSPKNRPRNSDPDKLMDLPNQPIATLASMMEGYFEKPVIDQTGLTSSYNITLEGKWQTNLQANLDFINKALPNQLGLELVPSREPVEMLVVEKVK